MSRFSAPGTGTFTPIGSRPTAFQAVSRGTNGGPKPTPEQDAILRAANAGTPRLVVEALAGTGKTTTLRMLAHTRPTLPTVYVAYNKSVALEARGRFPDCVEVSTAHSLAFRALGHQYGHRLPGKQSTSRRMYARELAQMLSIRGGPVGDTQLTPTQVARLAEATVRMFCLSASHDIGVEHLPARSAHLGTPAEVGALVVPAARRIWRDVADVDGRSYFTHDHYLKLWQLTNPVLPVACVLFDEAQDANPPVAAVVAAQTHAQLIYVGDQNQQMYAWRGAVDAMGKVDGDRLALTKSFRFGPRIADEANRWLAMLGSSHRVVGHDPIDSQIGVINDTPDALLCRTNGGALEAILRFQALGVPVAMAPGDATAGKDIMGFAYAAKSLMDGKGTDHPDLVAFRTWNDLLDYVENEEGGSDLGRLVKIVNRIGPGAVISAIRNLSPGRTADVTVSTAHKAKGLEWPRVRIAPDFAPPDPGEEEPSVAEKRAAQMVAYVSVTRARQFLDPGPLNADEWS